MNPLKVAWWTTVTTAALIIGPCSLHAEEPAPSPATIHANVESVEDMRSTMFANGCRINAVLFGDDLDEMIGVVGTRITKAEDDVGRSLVPLDQADSRMPMIPLLRIGAQHAPLHALFTLRNPSRRAATIKVLEATVRLFHPTQDNGGLVIITSPTLHPGAPLKNEVLAKNRIELVYVRTEDGTSFPILGASAPTSLDEQRRLEAVAAEVAARRVARERIAATASETPPTDGLTESASTTIPPSSAHVETTEPAAASPRPTRRTMYRTVFRVVDPGRRLLGLEWRDGTEGRVHGFGGWGIEETRTVITTERPTDNWTLVVYVGTDDAIVSQPIHLQNIALP